MYHAKTSFILYCDFMQQKYLFANWKMYLDHAESVTLARQLAEQVGALPAHISMAVFPSHCRRYR